MSDPTDVMNDLPKKSRAAKPKRTRRPYAEEYKALAGRVEMALRLLRRAGAETAGVGGSLIAVAIETLEGVE